MVETSKSAIGTGQVEFARMLDPCNVRREPEFLLSDARLSTHEEERWLVKTLASELRSTFADISPSGRRWASVGSG